MISDIHRIAELLGITETAAGEICIKVRSFISPKPSLQALTRLVVDYLEAHPRSKANPGEIARGITASNPGTRQAAKSTISLPAPKPVPASSTNQKPGSGPTPPKPSSAQRNVSNSQSRPTSSSIRRPRAKPAPSPKSLPAQGKAPVPEQPQSRRRSDISYDSLVEATAKLLPAKDRGNREAARKLLDKLYSGDERLQQLSNQQMLKAMRKAYEKYYFISTDTVWEAARFMLPEGKAELRYGREILIPMGGKN